MASSHRGEREEEDGGACLVISGLKLSFWWQKNGKKEGGVLLQNWERELIEGEGEMKGKEGRGFCRGNGFGGDHNLIDLGCEIEGLLAPGRKGQRTKVV